jgi:hypothetical protein
LLSFSSIMNGGHVQPSSVHGALALEAPPLVHVPPDAAAAGVSRYHKLSFLTYEGKEDPLGWLNRCERFFRAQLTHEADKVWLASFHLTGTAQQWYYVMECDAGVPSWEEFKVLCDQRFGLPLTTNHLAELACLPFTSDVATYLDTFQVRMAHAGRLAPLQ